MGEGDENIVYGPELKFPIPNVTIGQLLFMKLSTQPEENVLHVEAPSGRSITSPEFLLLSIRAAEGMKSLGMEQGDTVAFAGKNGIDIYAAAAGALFLGCVVAPIDPSMKSFEYQHIFKVIQPKLVFSDVEAAEEISDALTQLENPASIVLIYAEQDEETSHTKFEDFLQMPEDVANAGPAGVEDNSQSIAFIVCSSGTTGMPKGVLLSDKCLLIQLLMWQQNSETSSLGKIPFLHTSHFFWISGVLLFISGIAAGFQRIISRNVDEESILQAIQEYKPTWGLLAPSLLTSLMAHPEFTNYDVSSMLAVFTGGSPLQKATVAKFREIWSPEGFCSQGYGCSEIGGIATNNTTPDISSIGCPGPGVEMKVVDSEGKALGPGESGEIYIRTACVMTGYAGNEEATNETKDDEGWIHSGDIGFYNEENLFYISGRIKEFIKYKNLQIAPAEIEELISSLPGVTDAGVAGIPVDPDTYYPMALVVKSEGSEITEEDIAKCVNENLSEFKQLRGGICFVEEIPRTPTGKIKRTALQTLAKSLYLEDL